MAILWMTLVLLPMFAGCGRQVRGGSVILVLLDAARADRVGPDPRITPNLHELAQRGWLFENHFSQATATLPAIPRLLFSRYFVPPLFPGSAKLPLSTPGELFRTFDSQSISLPAALSRAGYRTALISAHSWFRSSSRLVAEFDESLNLAEESEYEERYGYPSAAQVIDAAIDWIDENSQESYFLYLHLMDTHFPHFPGSDSRWFIDEATLARVDKGRFHKGGRPVDLSRPLSQPERVYLDALYNGSARYADRELGRLFEHLRITGMLDGTIIVVTSDHGEHLLEVPGRFGHGGPWYDAVARVPLIVFAPERIAAGRAEIYTESVDVMPTILALAGAELPADKQADGKNVFEMIDNPGEAKKFVFGPKSIRGPRFKLVAGDSRRSERERNPTRPSRSPLSQSPSFELYDSQTDPLEIEDLSGLRPDTVRDLHDAYSSRLAAPMLRYQRARTTMQPASAFAISARHFEMAETVEEVAGAASRTHRLQDFSPGGWYRSRHWSGYFLLTRGPAEPLELGFPVPDGEYSVSIAAKGSWTVSLADQEPIQVKGEEVEIRQLNGGSLSAQEFRLGTVVVDNNRFSMQVSPASTDSLSMIRHIGFVPVGAEESAGEEDQAEFEKRLRTLGYLD